MNRRLEGAISRDWIADHLPDAYDDMNRRLEGAISRDSCDLWLYGPEGANIPETEAHR